MDQEVEIFFFGIKKKFNKKKYYLEKIYKGIELSIEVLSINSNHKIICSNIRVINKTMSAMGIFHFNDIVLSKKFKNQVKIKLNKLKVLNGVSHLECIIQKNGSLNFFDINLRCGGFGVSDYFIPQIYKTNVFELDFNALYFNKSPKPLHKNKNYVFILFNSKNSDHFKKNLILFKKNLIYEKFSIIKNINKNLDLDSNRTELLCGGFNKKIIFLNNLKKILKLDSFNKIITIHKNLKKII